MRNYCILFIVFCAVFCSCKKGTQGRNGLDGTDGTDGTNGKNSLIDFVTEPAGANCSSGGYKVLSGIDQNGNGILDASEVQITKYLCNGTNGKNSLIDFVTEPAGANCANGGYKVFSGLDQNSNGILEAGEVQATQYLCNVTSSGGGTNGKNSLIDFVTEPAGANCANGGYKVFSGLDQNSNGVLDANEVQVTKYLCNGANGNGNTGRNSLISFVTEPAGSNCARGGYKVTSGVDTNGNNVLDAAEVQTTAYICNGNEGLNSLTSVVAEASGGNCTNGGFRVTTGLDVNRNNVLDNNEVQGTQYICNTAGGTGTNGYNSLVDVVPEPIGSNCAGGGNRINYGMDLNRNNVLDNNEITRTTYMCNANRVYAAIVSQQGANAPIGVPLVNNLGVTVTWSRTAAGRYNGAISPAVNPLKTLVLSNNTNVTTVLNASGTAITLENVCSPTTLCDNFANVTVGLLVVD